MGLGGNMKVASTSTSLEILSLKDLASVVFSSLKQLLEKASFYNSPAIQAVMQFYRNSPDVKEDQIELASAAFLFRHNSLPSATDIINELDQLQSDNSYNTMLPIQSTTKSNKSALNSINSINQVKKIKNVSPPKKEDRHQTDVKLLEREHRYLKERFVCINCKVNMRSMIALPCGDISYCKQCSEDYSTCPSCRKAILAEAEVFMT